MTESIEELEVDLFIRDTEDEQVLSKHREIVPMYPGQRFEVWVNDKLVYEYETMEEE